MCDQTALEPVPATPASRPRKVPPLLRRSCSLDLFALSGAPHVPQCLPATHPKPAAAVLRHLRTRRSCPASIPEEPERGAE